MRNQPGIAAKMFECLSKNKINIEVISTSEIKISVLIDKDKTCLLYTSPSPRD